MGGFARKKEKKKVTRKTKKGATRLLGP